MLEALGVGKSVAANVARGVAVGAAILTIDIVAFGEMLADASASALDGADLVSTACDEPPAAATSGPEPGSPSPSSVHETGTESCVTTPHDSSQNVVRGPYSRLDLTIEAYDSHATGDAIPATDDSYGTSRNDDVYASNSTHHQETSIDLDEVEVIGEVGLGATAGSFAVRNARSTKTPLTILCMTADPADANRLRLAEEVREIAEQLRLSKLRERFVLEQRTAVRARDITLALLDLHPEIVHFSGHGTSNGALCIQDASGNTQFIQPDALAALFAEFSSHVKCVILNACYSALQAKAIAAHIDYVIGMDEAIGDRAAIAFALGFYQSLGVNHSIPRAYRMGCIQIGMQGIDERLTPKLVTRTAT